MISVAAALDPDRSRALLPSRTASVMSGAVFLSMGLMAMVSLRFVDEAHAVQALRAEIAAESVVIEPEQVEEVAVLAAKPRPLDRVRKLEAWFQAFPERLEGVILQGMEVDESRRESSLFVPFVEADEPELSEGDDSLFDVEPVVVRAVLAAQAPLIVPVKAQPIDIEKIDWRSFSRRSGSRRGSTVVLNYQESVCNRYARLSPTDRKKQRSFRSYLRRNGVHLNEAGMRRLIERTRRNQL